MSAVYTVLKYRSKEWSIFMTEHDATMVSCVTFAYLHIYVSIASKLLASLKVTSWSQNCNQCKCEYMAGS